MKNFLLPLVVLALSVLCANAQLKSLMYNTNGHVVASTNVVWTNAFSFSSNAVAAQTRTNLGAVADDDARLSDTRDPNAHAASHFSAGADPIAPSDIGAQSLFSNIQVNVTDGDVTLDAGRAVNVAVLNFGGQTRNITLPSSPLVGDVLRFSLVAGGGIINIQRLDSSMDVETLFSLSVSNQGPIAVIATLTNLQGWRIVPVDTHVHAASDITSGTLDVARLPVGTGSNQVAAGDHTHTAADIGLTNVVQWTAVPSATNSTGIAGQAAYTNNYLYICVSNNVWRRVQLGTW